MGRLQKKKTTVEKTRQRLKIKQKPETYEGNDIDTPDKSGTAVKKSLFGAGNLKDNKIKLVQPATQAPIISKLSELGQGDSFIARSVEFFREVKVELNKVTWPSKQQTTASTIVVIILVIIMSIFLGLVDFSLSKIIEILLH